MEYKVHKRTKNLTLREIHVGDWVQVWSEETERYSPPMKIIYGRINRLYVEKPYRHQT